MNIVKGFLLVLLLGISSMMGNMFAKSYGDRVKELQQIKNIFNTIKTKISYIGETMPEIIEEIANKEIRLNW